MTAWLEDDRDKLRAYDRVVSEGERVFVQAEFEGIAKLANLWETRCGWLEGSAAHPEWEARFAATEDVVREWGARSDAFAEYLAQPVSFVLQSLRYMRPTLPAPTPTLPSAAPGVGG